MMKAYKDPAVLKHFIQRIYQSVISPDSIYGVMDELRSVIDASCCALQIEDVVTFELGRSFFINYDDKAVDAYAQYYISRDPWTVTGCEGGLFNHSFTAAQRLVADKNYRESEFYRDWGRHNGVRHAIGCSFDIDDGSMLKINFQRGADQLPFDDDIELFLNWLHPHFKQFVRLSPMFEEVAARYTKWQQSLEYLDRPVWVVDAKLQVVFMNTQAEQWVSSGKYLSCENSVLFAKNIAEQKELLVSVNKMSKLSSSLSLVGNDVVSHERLTLGQILDQESIWVSPFINSVGKGLVMITGRKSLPELNVLMQRHNLTKRQAQLCSLLVKGYSVQDSAVHLNIAVNTVRNTLAACFRVLHVKNQSELIRTLLGDVIARV
jgi:DNA-binding CsgD family transcriptional regulator